MASSDIEINLPAGGRLPAYLAKAETDGPAGGVVILQEIFGVTDNLRAIADDYASQGFNAVVPDLFWRQEPGVKLDPSRPEDRERATQLMHGLDQALAVSDALAAAAMLRGLEGANGKVGAVGYCLGGKLAYLLSTEPGVDAAVSYYGVAIQKALDRAPDIRSPLLLHIAGDDHLCPPEAQDTIKTALGSQLGVTILTYPGVGHAFARRGGAGFDAAAADRADGATAALFAATLKAAG